jgi:hypothetical protein
MKRAGDPEMIDPTTRRARKSAWFPLFSRRFELSAAIGGWVAWAENARLSGEKAG